MSLVQEILTVVRRGWFLRWVVGVLVVRPLESQGKKLLSGSPTLPSSSSASGEQDSAGALWSFLDSRCADGKLLLDGLAGKAPGADPIELVEYATFEVAFFVGVNVVRMRKNKLGM